MGSGSSAPGAIDPNSYLFGSGTATVPGIGGIPMKINTGVKGIFDKQLYDQFLNQAKSGLSPEEKTMLEGKAGGMLRSGEQGLREQFAGSGAPIGAQVGANIALRGNNQKNLLESLTEGNLAAKQQGTQNVFGTLGLGMQGANALNQFNMNKYQVDKANEFSWGDALGSLLGAGGQVGSAAIGKPKTPKT